MVKLTHPKTGEKVTIQQFLKQWSDGMQKITPYQQCQSIQFGQIISLIGIIWGILFCIKLKYYWMMAILIGGAVVLGVQMLGNWQKKMILKNLDNTYNNAFNMDKEVKDGI